MSRLQQGLFLVISKIQGLYTLDHTSCEHDNRIITNALCLESESLNINTLGIDIQSHRRCTPVHSVMGVLISNCKLLFVTSASMLHAASAVLLTQNCL